MLEVVDAACRCLPNKEVYQVGRAQPPLLGARDEQRGVPSRPRATTFAIVMPLLVSEQSYRGSVPSGGRADQLCQVSLAKKGVYQVGRAQPPFSYCDAVAC